jgi:hypothetical protein
MALLPWVDSATPRISSARGSFWRVLRKALLPRSARAGACSIRLEGMPAIRLDRPPVALREYIPWLWIYTPLFFKWMWLALRYRSLTLPTIANPHIETGGIRGESKTSYLTQIGATHQRWVARSTLLRLPQGSHPWPLQRIAETKMAEAGLSYPIITKPDIGSCGYGVRLAHNGDELALYLERFPRDQQVMLQQYLPWAGEAGVFYVRRPGEARGQILSLGLRYFPHVTGDGRATLRELVTRDARVSRHAKLHCDAFAARLDDVLAEGEVLRLTTIASLRVGALYRDGADYATPELCRRIDEIARSMPDFFYGRFDVRFRSIDELARGEGFAIIEVNGAGAEAIHIWDPELTIMDAYRSLFRQLDIMFDIGARNRARGFRPMTARDLLGMQWKESKLLRAYPASN